MEGLDRMDEASRQEEVREPEALFNGHSGSTEEKAKKNIDKNLTTVAKDISGLNKKTKIFLAFIIVILILAFFGLGLRWGSVDAAKFFAENCMCNWMG